MREDRAILQKIRENSCAVLGVGVSNLPLIDVLLGLGAKVTAYDEKSAEALGDTAEILIKKGIELVTGEGAFDKVTEKVIFRSPGIRPDKGALPEAVRCGAFVTGEMEFFFESSKAKKYVITGSDGKTTTTTITHLFLSAQKEKEGARAYVGGNIGNPLLPYADKMSENDAAVLELSSFQLMGDWCDPYAAAITNITPNHLNWHTDMAEYIEAKLGAVGKSTKRVVLNADNEICASLYFGEDKEHIYFSSAKTGYSDVVPSERKNARVIFIRDSKIVVSDGKQEKELLSVADIKLPGKHNLENYMTAMALTLDEVDSDIYTDVAKSFGGVEHRLEFVCEIDGVKYYNSSIDSSPTRTAAALSALNVKPVVICGGSEKGLSFAPLADALINRAHAVVLNGDSRKNIKAALELKFKESGKGIEVYEEKTLGEAIDKAREIARQGDTVLLSPASASFDQFKNFAVRGEYFKSRVLSWKKDEN